MFLRIIQHLLPNARAWRLTPDKNLRRFFEGLLNGFAPDIKAKADETWLDKFPATTNQFEDYEEQFGIVGALPDMDDRRARLLSAWRALGGQDPFYIQKTLRDAGFDVYVHEWWVPGTEPPVGTLGTPTVRDPNTYLGDGETATQYLSADGAADMQDGDSTAQDGATAGPSGYALVNKISELSIDFIGDGSPEMFDGGSEAMDGGLQRVYTPKQYVIPTDPTVYPYFLYIGGETFPDKASVNTARKNEFEKLCLKICPAHVWIGVLVTYD